MVRLTCSGPFSIHRTCGYFLGQFLGVTTVLQPIANVFILSFSVPGPLRLWHLVLLSPVRRLLFPMPDSSDCYSRSYPMRVAMVSNAIDGVPPAGDANRLDSPA